MSKEKSKGLLWFCSSSVLAQVSSVARLFLPVYAEDLKQSTKLALSAQQVTVLTASERVQKEGLTKDPGATKAKHGAQPGRGEHFCNPDPSLPHKTYTVPRGYFCLVASKCHQHPLIECTLRAVVSYTVAILVSCWATARVQR